MRKANQERLGAYAELSDVEVLVLSRRDPGAFEALIDRYEEPFLRKASSILWTREDAEEVVQDAFTRIYLYADRFSPQEGATFSSWGYAILTRLAFTRYQKMKKERGRTASLDAEAYERLPDKVQFLDTLTARDEVLTVLARMPEAAARILSLQFLEGKTHEEIAESEGLSISAVKTRVHRAKQTFKDTLEHGH